MSRRPNIFAAATFLAVMSADFQDRLDRAAGRAFVGRETELRLFARLLGCPEPEHLVLFVHGPGGIGKSSLLRAYERTAQSAGLKTISLDARNFGEGQVAFREALAAGLGRPLAEDPVAAMREDSARLVLLVDTFELAGSLEAWLIRQFLPSLPINVLVVLAGRKPPSDEWRREPGWASLMRPVPLRNLRMEDARQMLVRAGVPEAITARLLAPTHGHPLAVSLVLELYQMKGGEIDPAESPDVVRSLVERLVMKVPSPSHRLALEACALAHGMTEELLAAMLAAPDVSAIFEWLRSLSFVESGPSGLFPHDVAREALAADLRWRNPGQYRELHKRARQFYVDAMHTTEDGGEQRRHLRDLVFLHRDNAVVQPLYQQLRADGGRTAISSMELNAADRTAVCQMIARHEGEESARLAQAWMDAMPESVTLFRNDEGVPGGCLFTVDVGAADPGLIEQDPGTRAARLHLEQNAPLRPGERASVFRFWLSADDYQHLSIVQMAIFVHMVQHYLMTPRLAHTYLPSGITEELEPVMAYGDIYRIPEADFEVDGRRFGMFGHDWRVRPPDVWLELMGQRQIGALPSESRPPVVESLVILDRKDFKAAVKEALQHYSRPRLLGNSVLLKSAVVSNRAEGDDQADRVEALRGLIADAAGQLAGQPKMGRAYGAIDRTYLRPAGSQELAAEMLDLPYSTFRRHLARGVAEVTDVLWQLEIERT